MVAAKGSIFGGRIPDVGVAGSNLDIVHPRIILQRLFPGIAAISCHVDATFFAPDVYGCDQNVRIGRMHKQAGDDSAAEAVTLVKHRPGLAAVVAAKNTDTTRIMLGRIGIGSGTVENAGRDINAVRVAGIDPDITRHIWALPDARPGQTAVNGYVDLTAHCFSRRLWVFVLPHARFYFQADIHDIRILGSTVMPRRERPSWVMPLSRVSQD